MYDEQEFTTDDTYYHYCSMDTFMKIIETATIRLSNPYKMNDSKEIFWTIDKMQTIVKDFIENTNDEDIKSSAEFFYDQSLQGVFNYEYKDKVYPYIACFSEDGDILSQWRAYADDGQGLAIGFNKDALIKLNKGLNFEDIEYNQDQQDAIIKDILQLDQIHEREWHRIKEVYMDVTDMIYEIIEQGINFKNPAFQEEKESRLIYFADYDSNQDNIKGPLFRNTKNDIIRYFELDFSSIKNKVINKIFIGPKSNMSEYDLKYFLKSKGYDTKIEIFKSSASYR